jgi:hypothetical protein
MEFQSPLPYRFNPWKHHLFWVCQQIEEVRQAGASASREWVLDCINAINSNQVDIYTGLFTPAEIVAKINDNLIELDVTKRTNLISWLGKKSFQLVSLSDSSIWVIREGNEETQYIHFHPARNSPNAVRIHGNSWKTALTINLLFPGETNLPLAVINDIRKKYLNLSPIKDLEGSLRLQSALNLLSNRQ